MTLAAGSRLGPYEILAPIGAGGMGEDGDVYSYGYQLSHLFVVDGAARQGLERRELAKMKSASE